MSIPRCSFHAHLGRWLSQMLAAGVSLLFSATVLAQPRALTFEHISTTEGLSSYSITSLLQDSRGFLWIGTQGGLNRYEGKHPTIFRPIPGDEASLSNEFIDALLESPKGSGILWIGTRGGGLNKFDPDAETFTRYRHDSTRAGTLSNDFVRALYEDQAGRLWVGTFDSGLNLFDPETETFTAFRHDKDDPDSLGHNEVWTIYEAPSRPGVLWIGTSSGLHVFEVDEQRFIHYRHDPNDPNSLSHDVVTSILESPTTPGVFWIGTTGGGLNKLVFEQWPESDGEGPTYVPRFTHYTRERHGLSSNHVSVIRKAKMFPGQLWVGTRGGGLNLFDPETETFTAYRRDLDDPQSLSHDDVMTVLEDRTNVLWVGTWTGLNRLTRQRFAAHRADSDNPNSLNHPQLFLIYEAPSEPDVIWIATFRHGLNRYDRKTGRYQHYFTEPDSPLNFIFSMYEDNRGTFWIGAGGDNIYQFDRTTGQVVTYPLNPSSSSGHVHEFYESPSEPGILWITTTDAGLFKYDARSHQILRHYTHKDDDPNTLSHNYIWDLHESREGVFWIGTGGGGLNLFDPETETFTHYRHDDDDPTSLSSDRIVAIREDAEGTLWLGTSDQGLNRFDPKTETATRYTQADGLPHTDVGGIEIDDRGRLWMITSNGFSRFDPRLGIFTNFDVRDGMQDNIYHYLCHFKNRRGEIFVCGANGLNIFHPDSIVINETVPNVVIINVLASGEPVQWDTSASVIKEVVLPYNRNDLTFEFAALDYRQPWKNQYKVKLEDIDSDWVPYGTQRTARYPALPPGKYTFRVIGSNNDGVWNEEGTSVAVTIEPPIWGTWWFLPAIVLLAAGLVAVAFTYRIYKIREIEHTRKQIADDLHDDISGRMSSIALMIDIISNNLHLEDKKREQYDAISEKAREVVKDLRYNIWMVDGGYDNLPELLIRMKQVTGEMLSGMHYRFYKPEGIPPIQLKMEQRRHLFLFYKEVLHNIARHASAERVETHIAYEGGFLTIRVKDNGVGFDPDTVKRGRGLANLQMRADKLRGTVSIHSKLGRGTTVELAVHIGRKRDRGASPLS